MEIPKLTEFIANNSRGPNAIARFETSLKTLQGGLDAKHIWNVDFVEAKDWLVRMCDEAMEDRATAWLHADKAADRHSRFAPDDVRWEIYYKPQVSNTPGAYKRLLKFVGTGEGAEFDAAVEMIGEVAQVAELIKSLKPFIVKGPQAPRSHRQTTGATGS